MINFHYKHILSIYFMHFEWNLLESAFYFYNQENKQSLFTIYF